MKHYTILGQACSSNVNIDVAGKREDGARRKVQGGARMANGAKKAGSRWLRTYPFTLVQASSLNMDIDDAGRNVQKGRCREKGAGRRVLVAKEQN